MQCTVLKKDIPLTYQNGKTAHYLSKIHTDEY